MGGVRVGEWGGVFGAWVEGLSVYAFGQGIRWDVQKRPPPFARSPFCPPKILIFAFCRSSSIADTNAHTVRNTKGACAQMVSVGQTTYGHVWPRMATYGHVWPRLANHVWSGHFNQTLVWPCKAHPRFAPRLPPRTYRQLVLAAASHTPISRTHHHLVHTHSSHTPPPHTRHHSAHAAAQTTLQGSN